VADAGFHDRNTVNAARSWGNRGQFALSLPEPDQTNLAIEVVWTHGRIDKLDIYRQLGVAEVCYSRAGQIQPYALRGERYEPIGGSEVLPGLDLQLLTGFIDQPTTRRENRSMTTARWS